MTKVFVPGQSLGSFATLARLHWRKAFPIASDCAFRPGFSCSLSDFSKLWCGCWPLQEAIAHEVEVHMLLHLLSR